MNAAYVRLCQFLPNQIVHAFTMPLYGNNLMFSPSVVDLHDNQPHVEFGIPEGME
jgi:hypothetical protein